MKRMTMILVFLLWSGMALAADIRYQIRVDGLACPYCAYGIEKKLKAIPGVEQVEVDLDHGLVTVRAREGTELTEPDMRTLFRDAGFTFRSMKVLAP